MHAVCLAMLGPLPCDLTIKKKRNPLWALIAGCIKPSTAAAACARLYYVVQAFKLHPLEEKYNKRGLSK